MRDSQTINVHAVLPSSAVNGPGTRLVVFFQGCGRDCPGCFNPETHSTEPRSLTTARELLGRYVRPGIEGLTVSGGEPFDQTGGLVELLAEARSTYGLTTVVYTGFKFDEIAGDAARAAALSHIDVLIDGCFDSDMAEPTMLARGSTNQSIHLLTGRYTDSDLVMPGKVEVIITADGRVLETGFSRAAAAAL